MSAEGTRPEIGGGWIICGIWTVLLSPMLSMKGREVEMDVFPNGPAIGGRELGGLHQP